MLLTYKELELFVKYGKILVLMVKRCAQSRSTGNVGTRRGLGA